jgi:hypothetical protein
MHKDTSQAVRRRCQPMALARHLARRLTWAIAAMALISLGLPLSAQTTSGTVSGVVKDPQGAGMPTAVVTLTSGLRGTVLTANVGKGGEFTFASVPPETYTLLVKADGFKPAERTRVVVNAADRLNLGTITIELGGISETVSVTADVALLQTQSAERSFAVTGESMQKLAVNGRGFFNMAFLAPGVVVNGASNPANQESQAMSANGQRPSTNNVTLDGVTDVDTGNNGGPMVAISTDSVQEVKILTSNYQAEYGRSSGAQVMAVTKSGTRDFHGSAYAYRRADDLNANTWINGHTPGRDLAGNQLTYSIVPPLDQRDLGFTVGGPVYLPGKFNKDKNMLFFFISQEHQKRLNPALTQNRVRVPTLLERQGDFSQTRDNAGALFPYIRDYTTGLPCSAADTRGCFQDGGVIGKIPANRLYSFGVNILKMYPAPNSDGTINQGYNYATQAATSQPERQDLLRLDWNASSKWRVTGKILNNKSDRLLPYGSFVLASNMPDYSISYLFPRRAYSLSATGTLNDSTFVEVTLGYSHNSIDILPDQSNPTKFTKTALGLTGIPTIYPNATQLDLPPRFTYGGRVANAPNLGTNNAPFYNFNTTKDAIVSLTKLKGAHTLKAGVFFQHSLKPQSSFANANGSISFTNDTANPFDTGFPYANAITGVYQSYNQASGYFIGNYIYRNVEWYLQDNWKASKKLTLDYGIRFYYMEPQHDTLNQTANFQPELYSASKASRLYYPGLDSTGARVAVDRATGQTLPAIYIGRIVPNSGQLLNGVSKAGQGIEDTLYKSSGILFGPRFGFTYDPSGEGTWIIRGGGGAFYDRSQGNSVFDLLGNPPTTLSPTFNNGRLQDINPNNILLGPPGLVAYDHSGKIPTTYSFNIGAQVKLPWSTALDISYVGARARNQLQARNLNSVPYGAMFLPQNQDTTLAASTTPGATSLPADFLRPYQGYGDIRMAEAKAKSDYNSVQMSLNRRFTDGLLLNVSYTLSKAKGTVSNDNNNGLTSFDTPRIDGNQQQANYGPLDFDRPHNFIGSFVWEIPKTKATGVLGQVLNNWQFSGVYRWQSGQPYNLSVSIPGIGSQNLLGTTTTAPARVVLVGDPGSGNSSDPYRQFNTAAITIPKPGTIGLDSGRNFLRTAPTNNWDLFLSKQFPMGGARKLELRVDAFNALNHTQFYTVNTSLAVRSLADPTPTNLPFDAAGNLVNPTGFGAVTAVRPPRTIQLTARFQF